MKIGVFDSGYGGLTVLAQCLKELKQEHKSIEFIYYADSDYAPYGERTLEEVQQLTERAVRFLIQEKNVSLVVIACNTATSLAIELLRKKYEIPIIGIEPAIKPASLNQAAGGRILVTATPLMVKSPRLEQRITELGLTHQVDRVALPQLVRIAEDLTLSWEEKQRQAKAYLEEKLPHSLTRSTGAVVLGCTHFPIFKSAYEQVFEERGKSSIYLADGSEGVARAVGRWVKSQPAFQSGVAESRIQFYQSGRSLQPIEQQSFQLLLAQIQQQISEDQLKGVTKR